MLKYCVIQKVNGESHVLAYFTNMMKATIFIEKLDDHYNHKDPYCKEFLLKAWDQSFPEVDPEQVWDLRQGVK